MKPAGLISVLLSTIAISRMPGFLVAALYAGMGAHALVVTEAILVLVWALHLGGGAHLHSENKELILSVCGSSQQL